MFITFEGGEGTGKSTQAKLLAEYLISQGEQVVLTREPGGSPGAESIRSLLVTGAVNKWSVKSEVLLIYAARIDHFEKVIQPALALKKWVICDRFADSTIAYQGYGRGFDITFLHTLYQQMIGAIEPDLTFIFDLNAEDGLQRAKKRINSQNSQEGRFEAMDVAFHERLRQGFLHIAAQYPSRCKVISATLSEKTIHQKIIQQILLRKACI